MTGRETATVETLTASVKTLMVGARQVTLTIFKQLDVVGYHEMTPFGRVSPNGHETDWATIVGRRNVSGELVRGRVPVTREAVLQHTGMSALARDALRWRDSTALSPMQEIRRTVADATGTIELMDVGGVKYAPGKALAAALQTALPEQYGHLTDAEVAERIISALGLVGCPGVRKVSANGTTAMAYAVSDLVTAAEHDVDLAPRHAAESQATVDEATAPYMAVAEEVSALPLIVLAGLA